MSGWQHAPAVLSGQLLVGGKLHSWRVAVVTALRTLHKWHASKGANR
jgi:hypothetical protein